MKGRSLLLSAILILLAGVVLIITYKTTSTNGITIVGGVLFIVAGLLNIFSYLGEQSGKSESAAGAQPTEKQRVDKKYKPSSLTSFLAWTASAATILLGLSMLVWTATFSVWVPALFGILVCLSALYQFYLLAIGSRPVRLPNWLFAMPVLLLIAGIYLFMQKPSHNEAVIMMVTGISFVVFSATLFVESILIGAANRKMRRESSSDDSHEPADASHQVEDVKPLDE